MIKFGLLVQLNGLVNVSLSGFWVIVFVINGEMWWNVRVFMYQHRYLAPTRLCCLIGRCLCPSSPADHSQSRVSGRPQFRQPVVRQPAGVRILLPLTNFFHMYWFRYDDMLSESLSLTVFIYLSNFSFIFSFIFFFLSPLMVVKVLFQLILNLNSCSGQQTHQLVAVESGN